MNPPCALPSFIKFYSCISSSHSLVRSSVERIPFDDYLVRGSLWSAPQHASISIYIKLVLLFRSIPIESFLFRCSVLRMQREQSKVPKLISACLQRRLNSSWIANGRCVSLCVCTVPAKCRLPGIPISILLVRPAVSWKGICLVAFLKRPIYALLIRWIWLGTDCEIYCPVIAGFFLCFLKFFCRLEFYIGCFKKETTFTEIE